MRQALEPIMGTDPTIAIVVFSHSSLKNSKPPLTSMRLGMSRMKGTPLYVAITQKLAFGLPPRTLGRVFVGIAHCGHKQALRGRKLYSHRRIL